MVFLAYSRCEVRCGDSKSTRMAFMITQAIILQNTAIWSFYCNMYLYK